MKSDIFKMPVPVKIMGRTSSITNAFVNGIIPVVEPSESEIDEVLETLGMTRESICCAYCGDKYTEWDHFRPLIDNKKPTGYISEIYNLVPACGKCNQSKGNKNWKDWMFSDASLSPKTRGISDLDERAEKLEAFQNKYDVKQYDFESIVGAELWKKHWESWEALLRMMKESQKTSDKIKELIKSYVQQEGE